mmetsp:Transcript_22690/g.53668  ORF Transcript_22690/g.53668 Transcript_22690/m.53668 type:complete len:194 (+) Transcript_22690:146-727(+)
MQAKKVKDTPFPFPYAQLVMILLLVFVVSSPMVITVYVENLLATLVLSFCTTLGAVALNIVSAELEDPFGYDPNDLPLTFFHHSFNFAMLTCLNIPDLFDLENSAADMCSDHDHSEDTPPPLSRGTPKAAHAPAMTTPLASASLLLNGDGDYTATDNAGENGAGAIPWVPPKLASRRSGSFKGAGKKPELVSC